MKTKGVCKSSMNVDSFRLMVGKGGDGDIDFPGLQSGQGPGGIAGLDVDHHLRMGLPEPSENPRQDGKDGGYRTVQGEFAAQRGIAFQMVLKDRTSGRWSPRNTP